MQIKAEMRSRRLARTVLAVVAVLAVGRGAAQAQARPDERNHEADSLPRPYRPFQDFAAAEKDFQAGRRLRLSGILVTSIGAGVGVATLMVAGMEGLLSGLCMDSTCSSSNEAMVMAVTGASILTGSLVVGLPLLISGQARVKRARSRMQGLLWGGVGVGVASNGALVSSRWEF